MNWQSSLTTKKNISLLSLSCNTDLNFNLINEGKKWKNLSKATLKVNQPAELCNISDLFKAVLKGGYSFVYLNMAADCFPLKPAS